MQSKKFYENLFVQRVDIHFNINNSIIINGELKNTTKTSETMKQELRSSTKNGGQL